MDYTKYQNARDAAWAALIKNNVTALPVKISDICQNDGIAVVSYSRAGEMLIQMGLEKNTILNDGFSICIRKSGRLLKCIFFDDRCSIQRQRFTVAHEYGHFLCGHMNTNTVSTRNRESFESADPIEIQANAAAVRILAPACVLWGLNVHDAETIAKLCDISLTAAKWRMKRLNILYERERDYLATRGKSCFLMSAAERAVYRQFEAYINANRKL